MVAVHQRVMVFPTVLDDLLHDRLAASVELDLEWIATHEEIGVETCARADEHAETVAVALFAEAREGDSPALERKLVRHPLYAAAFNRRRTAQLGRE